MRGGKRPGAGRKPRFIETKTITVRISKESEPEIREAIKNVIDNYKGA